VRDDEEVISAGADDDYVVADDDGSGGGDDDAGDNGSKKQQSFGSDVIIKFNARPALSSLALLPPPAVNLPATAPARPAPASYSGKRQSGVRNGSPESDCWEIEL
jgi:hypothetical protein